MESVDAVGIAFHAAYWIWYERAFEGFVAAASDSSWRELLEAGLAMPVVHAEIDYLHPLRLSEEVAVEMRLMRTGSRSVHFETRFARQGELLAVARTVHVVTSSGDLATAAMPSWLEAAVESAESGRRGE